MADRFSEMDSPETMPHAGSGDAEPAGEALAPGGPQQAAPLPPAQPQLTAAVTKVLHDWQADSLKACDRHSAACDYFNQLDSIYGIGSTVLAAAVASGVQTAGKYGQRAERHRQASRHYSTVTRQIDEILADPPSADQVKAAPDGLRKSLDDTGAMAPNVPPRIWGAPVGTEQSHLFRSHQDGAPALPADEPQA